MQLKFEKYQGTGNDFIIIDQREIQSLKHENQKLIERLCDRRFGIGADGLILLEKSPVSDFRMVYFNSDGRQSTMCGNGGRCIVHFAWSKGLCAQHTVFEAIDGLHEAEITEGGGIIRLHMSDVDDVTQSAGNILEMNTGSPHYITFVETMPLSIKDSGSEIRYLKPYAAEGINVNFAKTLKSGHSLEVCTYERGVEDETLSCGTGVTASALAYSIVNGLHGQQTVGIHTKGGQLSVSFDRYAETRFRQIWLCGPAVHVFSGVVDL